MDINVPVVDWKKWKGKCVICHNEINLDKENYIKLIDMKGKKQISYCLYHPNCWQNRFAVTSEMMNKMANQWLNKIADIAGGNKVIELK